MPAKRGLPSLGLERRVRPRREEEWEPESDPSDGSSASDQDEDSEDASEEETVRQPGRRYEEESSSGSEPDSDSEAESESEPEDATPKVDFSSISFGALAKAQASLPASDRKAKRLKRSTDAEDDEAGDDPSSKASLRAAKHTNHRGKPPPPPKRSSKHAPQEQSSKRAVPRRREILSDDTPRRVQARDPRFDKLGVDNPGDDDRLRKNYAFLDEYREKELADLRAQIKKAKDPALKQDLKRQVMSMESRKKATQRKDEEVRLLAEHRAREKELVAQGKQPFYLKRSEQKKQLLTNRFAGMSKGQVDRAIERKRKKVAGKEKQELDTLQRVRNRR